MGLVGCGRGPVGAAGGVEKVWLVPVGEITARRYDAAAGGYTEVVLRKGACFARYDFAEDTASYRQYVSGGYPMSCIVHELSFAFHGTGGDAAAVVNGLAASGGEGVAALVRTAEGGVWLAGWSPEFGEECPLRLADAVSETSEGYDGNPYVRVTLRSEDVSLSRPFLGAVPE